MEQQKPYVATFETGRHYQVHKSYIWVGPIVAVFAMAFLTLVNGIQGWIELAKAIQAGDIHVNPLLVIGLIVLGLIVLIGLFIGLYALAWRNMSYVFDEREFSFYSGIITKRRVHVPYARVQSVNHRASLIQRLFGVCTVTIDSAGGSANKGVMVPYLQLEVAERMRAELFVRKAAVAAGATPTLQVDAGAEFCIYLTLKSEKPAYLIPVDDYDHAYITTRREKGVSFVMKNLKWRDTAGEEFLVNRSGEILRANTCLKVFVK